MKNAKTKLATIAVAAMTISTIFVGCEKDSLQSNEKSFKADNKIGNVNLKTFDSLPNTLNKEDVIGIKLAKAVKQARTIQNVDSLTAKLSEISLLKEREQEEYQPNEEDVNLLTPLYDNFVSSSFDSFISISDPLIKSIRRNSEYSEDRKTFLIKRISRFEWFKYGLEIEISGDELERPNPIPGDNESYDNYIDRCMENWINENITWANWSTRVMTILGGPAGLGGALASCTETYIF